jgi:hypothetical protein
VDTKEEYTVFAIISGNSMTDWLYRRLYGHNQFGYQTLINNSIAPSNPVVCLHFIHASLVSELKGNKKCDHLLFLSKCILAVCT